ncbi:hypothetical protein CBL_10024 [Carabus blaptoides fortunei]
MLKQVNNYLKECRSDNSFETILAEAATIAKEIDCETTFPKVGSYGSTSDGGIFAKFTLQKVIEENQLHLPGQSVILGDEAFPLKTYTLSCKAYSRIRFRSPISLATDTVISLVKATCALHNWIRNMGSGVINPITVDIEDHETERIIPECWRIDPKPEGLVDLTPVLHRNYLPEARQKETTLLNSS